MMMNGKTHLEVDECVRSVCGSIDSKYHACLTMSDRIRRILRKTTRPDRVGATYPGTWQETQTGVVSLTATV